MKLTSGLGRQAFGPHRDELISVCCEVIPTISSSPSSWDESTKSDMQSKLFVLNGVDVPVAYIQILSDSVLPSSLLGCLDSIYAPC